MGREKTDERKIIIVGATSGIGQALATNYLSQGNVVGITGRRTESLQEMKAKYPATCFYRTMDVQEESSLEQFDSLLQEMGGMDVMIYCAGAGTQNPPLDMETEMVAVRTNVDGFMRIVIRSFNYFKDKKSGHIVDISSIAGMRPLRHSPAYSSTKKYQAHYMSCLTQKANHERLRIKFTTVFPGWIKTGMLKHDYPIVTSLDKGTHLIAKAIDKRKRRAFVPGGWRFVVALWSIIPNAIYERL